MNVDLSVSYKGPIPGHIEREEEKPTDHFGREGDYNKNSSNSTNGDSCGICGICDNSSDKKAILTSTAFGHMKYRYLLLQNSFSYIINICYPQVTFTPIPY